MKDGLFIILFIALVLGIIVTAVVGLFLKDRAGNTPLILHSIIVGMAVILGLVGIFYYRSNVVKKKIMRDSGIEMDDTSEPVVTSSRRRRRSEPIYVDDEIPIHREPEKEGFIASQCRKYLKNRHYSCVPPRGVIPRNNRVDEEVYN